MTWISPDTVRADTCCGATAPDKCVAFVVTLHPQSEGIIFDICDGAVPPGALFYQVGCGPLSQVGEALCLSGPGPHFITFCKPGNNQNKYCITAIAEPAPGPDAYVGDGCNGWLTVEGFQVDSIEWTSVFPGTAGAYDNYLDCTSGCDSVNISAGANPPDSVIYEACGPLLGGCESGDTCVQMTAYFISTLDVEIAPENPTICVGQSGTYIHALGQGGVAPYQYLWNNGQTTDSIFVGTGTFIVEVSDSTGCPPAFDTVTVDSFTMPIEAIAGNDTTICGSTIALNGQIMAANGGVWLGAGGAFSPDSTDLQATYTPTQQEINLGFTQLMLATTGNGSCPADTDTMVVQWHAFNSIPTIESDSVSCNGFDDGSLWISSFSGIGVDSIIWLTNPLQYGDSISGLLAGTYQVRILDSLGCDSVFEITVYEPSPLLHNFDSVSHPSCFGLNDGYLSASSTGGVGPYSWSWSNGFQTSEADSLSGGTYEVTITDANGCADTLAYTLIEPDSVVFVPSIIHVSCFGLSDGEIDPGVSGGYGNFIFDWSNGATSEEISNLSAGSYELEVIYGSGCLDSITLEVIEPVALTVTISSNDVSCHGDTNGSALAQVVGGTGPYEFLWSNATNDSLVNGLDTGWYYLTVTDNNGCDTTDSTLIQSPAILQVMAAFQDVSCFGGSDGSANSNPVGGNGGYAFTWSTGAATDSIQNLIIGSYTVTVVDSLGCSADSTIQIQQPSEIQLELLKSDASCYGLFDGKVWAIGSGGTPVYSYVWSSGSVIDSAINLGAGQYTVTITDANNCTKTRVFNIHQPDELIVSVSPDVWICLGEEVQLAATAEGGNGGYAFSWSHGLGSSPNVNAAPTSSTTYQVSVTDSLDCPMVVEEVRVKVKPIAFDEVEMMLEPSEICEGEESTISATYLGDPTTYTFLWSHGLGDQPGSHVVSPSQNEEYAFSVIDECGFDTTVSISLIVNPRPALDLPDTLLTGCAPFNAQFEAPSTNVPIDEYAWNFVGFGQSAVQNPSVAYSNAGTYTVKLQLLSAAGCTSMGKSQSKVVVFPSPTASFSVSPDHIDTDNPVANITSTSDAVISHSWTISDGTNYTESSFSHRFHDHGLYRVLLEVINEFGCPDTTSQSIRVHPVLRLEAPTAFTPNQERSSGGQVDLNDLSNDVFYLRSEFATSIHLLVFNRWGEIVFESFDMDRGWDGFYREKPAPMAMYVWKAEVVFVTGDKRTETGNVTLLR